MWVRSSYLEYFNEYVVVAVVLVVVVVCESSIRMQQRDAHTSNREGEGEGDVEMDRRRVSESVQDVFNSKERKRLFLRFGLVCFC
jgi:hypothetical protein